MSGEFCAFFYEVLYSVCYGIKSPPQAICDLHTFTPALLHDYCRHRVRHADYPGVIAEKGCLVRGVYATGLTFANLCKLDAFEGSEYERITAKVKLLRMEEGREVQGQTKDAIVYVYLDPKALEKREWDFEEFRLQKLSFWTRESPDEPNANLS